MFWVIKGLQIFKLKKRASKKQKFTFSTFEASLLYINTTWFHMPKLKFGFSKSMTHPKGGPKPLCPGRENSEPTVLTRVRNKWVFPVSVVTDLCRLPQGLKSRDRAVYTTLTTGYHCSVAGRFLPWASRGLFGDNEEDLGRGGEGTTWAGV